jgi:hypothetical protein
LNKDIARSEATKQSQIEIATAFLRESLAMTGESGFLMPILFIDRERGCIIIVNK